MLKQHLRVQPPPLPADGWTAHSSVLDWIDSWALVREDILQLMAAYQQADGGHDVSPFLSLIDETDSSLRLLKHRVDWLRGHLGHPDAELLDERR